MTPGKIENMIWDDLFLMREIQLYISGCVKSLNSYRS